jgi:hypothetical protein
MRKVKLIEKISVLRNEEFHDFYRSPSVSMGKKCRRLRLAGHVVRKPRLEIRMSCRQVVTRRGRRNCAK